MRLICSFCRKFQGYKEPFDDERDTHGICPACYNWYMKQQDLYSVDDYLNTFDVPIIMVNEQGRVVGINKNAEQMLGKPSEQVQGLLGGEAMECIYARLPEGCGQTIHCPACTIRNLVEKTLSSKKENNKKIQLIKENETITITALTEYVDGLVRIQFVS